MMVGNFNASLAFLRRIALAGVSIACRALCDRYGSHEQPLMQERNVQFLRGTEHAVTLFNINAGLDPVTDAASEQTALLDAANTADIATQTLYLKLQSNSPEFDLYTGSAVVDTWDVVPSAFLTWDAHASLPYHDSLMNALGRWTLNARLLGASPISFASPNMTVGYFTVVHGTSARPTGLTVAVNESVVVLRDAALAQDSTLLKTAVSVLAISLGIFALLACVVIAPATSAVAREKHLLQVRRLPSCVFLRLLASPFRPISRRPS